MKSNWEDEYEIPAHIDLNKGKWVKNPFLQNFRELNLISLDEDVKKEFPDSEAVNAALRGLLKQARNDDTSEMKKAS